ncbi:hypothetical protein [Pelagibius sp.]|uniref:hypothetical protein n=1 Tax=Pelagibius sp. TaxID=1931238 RepID=UPI002628E989|nr:hypothetical protein [Pelagibius sp.]
MAAAAPKELLGIGSVLGTSLKVLGSNLLPFFTIAILTISPVYLFLYWWAWSESVFVSLNLWQLEIGIVLGEILLGFVTHAAVVYGTFQQLRGRRAGFVEIVLTGLRNALAVLAVAVVSSMLVMLGFLALVVPGIILATMYWVAIPAAVVEKTGIADSLARSSDLTRGHRWPVFALFLIFWVGQGLFDRLVESMFDFDGDYNFALAVTWLMSAAITALGAVVSTVTYYHLRRLKEGIGIDEIAAVFD